MNHHDAENLAIYLMDEHGLTFEGWTFAWDNTKRRFGHCRYSTQEIGLSAPLVAVNDSDVVRDVILHEIAHALVGPGHGHGPVWKAAARRIGANPRSTTHANNAAARWHGVCTFCGFVAERHRLTRQAKSAACPDCCRTKNGGRYNAAYLLHWRQAA